MKEIIQNVMASEEEAGRIIEEARGKATRIVAESRTAAQTASDNAKRALRNEADKIVADSVAAATAAADKAIAEAREKIEKGITLEGAARQSAANGVFAAVTGAGK